MESQQDRSAYNRNIMKEQIAEGFSFILAAKEAGETRDNEIKELKNTLANTQRQMSYNSDLSLSGTLST